MPQHISITLAVPSISVEKYSELTGLSIDTINDMLSDGRLKRHPDTGLPTNAGEIEGVAAKTDTLNEKYSPVIAKYPLLLSPRNASFFVPATSPRQTRSEPHNTTHTPDNQQNRSLQQRGAGCATARQNKSFPDEIGATPHPPAGFGS
jgi:hypothetical protein